MNFVVFNQKILLKTKYFENNQVILLFLMFLGEYIVVCSKTTDITFRVTSLVIIKPHVDTRMHPCWNTNILNTCQWKH